MAIVLSDEDSMLLCVDKDTAPCLLNFSFTFLFPSSTVQSSIVAKDFSPY